jgi:hypothetical protein
MADDLVKRLRRADTCIFPTERERCHCGEAADRILKLEAALREIAEMGYWAAASRLPAKHWRRKMADDLVKRLHKWVDDLEHDCDYNLQFELSGEEAGDFAEDISGALTRIEKLEAALAKIAQHDMQAIAMDALRPGDRIRKAPDAE